MTLKESQIFNRPANLCNGSFYQSWAKDDNELPPGRMSLPQAYIPGQAFEPKLQPELLGKNERRKEIRHLQYHRNGIGVERAVPSHRLLKPRGADPQLLRGRPLGFRSRSP